MFEIKRTAFNAEEFEQVRFVCKARSNDPGRPFTTVVHVERTGTGSRIIATDGKRMHIAGIKGRIPRGNYKPTVSRDSITFGEPVADIDFPDWKNIIPGKAVRKGTVNLEKAGISRNPSLAEGMSLALSDFVRKTGTVVSLRYLDDLPKKEWDLSIHRDRKTVILMEEKGTAGETRAVFVPLAEAA
jgi:hypothetical protein